MKKNFGITVLDFVIIFCFLCSFCAVYTANAMPFYDFKPQEIVLRAQFSTEYPDSSAERKHNIRLAAKSLDNVFVDAGGEFSFNKTVGERTVSRGYKTAKIIVKGEFVEGVGGGVCQVSTTLYNAVLLAGLDVCEVHQHSLAVGYVEPSFDAMVNSGSADLKFINRTHNPIIIRVKADDKAITVKIYGETASEKIERKSVVKREILPEYTVIKDEAGNYPDLFAGERRIIVYGKKGLESEGYLIRKVNGKTVSEKRIRKNVYSAINGIIVEGTAEREDTAISS